MSGEQEKSTPQDKNAQLYWQENIRLVSGLLLVWFLTSLGAGVIFVDILNKVQLGGFKLGFWFAQQGSIVVFVVLIFVYVWRMSIIEKRFGVGDE